MTNDQAPMTNETGLFQTHWSAIVLFLLLD